MDFNPAGIGADDPQGNVPKVNLPVAAALLELEVSQRPRLWPAFLAFFAALIGAIAAQIVAVLLVVAFFAFRGEDMRELAPNLPEKLATPALFIVLAAPAQLAIGMACLVPAWWRRKREPISERLGLVPAGLSGSSFALIVFSVLLPTALGLSAAQWLARYIPPDPSVAMMYENLTLLNAAPFVIFIALAPGFMEEMLFRGYIQRRLLERWSPWAAIGVTSVLFAALHIMPHAVACAFPIGIWLGVIAWRTGSIWPCIACHAFINGSINAVRAAIRLGGLPEPTVTMKVALLVVATICFLASTYILFRPGSAAEPAPNPA